MPTLKKILFSLLVVLVCNPSFAQHPPAPPGANGPGAPGSESALFDYLQLTADQKTAWQTARKDFDTSIQPLIEKQRETQKQIETALQNKSSDACGIGTLLLAARSIGDQIKTAHDALDQKLIAILTPEQKTRYEAFEAAAEFLRSHAPGAPPHP